MKKTYRTFEEIYEDIMQCEWRWDGLKMEIRSMYEPGDWEEANFTSPEELLEEENVTETTPKPMNTIYRTFEDTLPGMGGKWRWDGEKMEIRDSGEWFPSAFTSPEELLAEETITETTPKQES